ncbi:FAD-dependent oxidoreductase [Mesorhizobium sp. B2-3-10]|uniref:NAD(P)/FAD-dependent oxidoreductase n=1 Tax=Mesorhizobium sp. B2-3-10 TaxID=2589954 RepID=UPI001FEF7DF6|nr:FAD-dependent oxidoreductase [Mesorhizobium sp. B2-3-10]
MQLAKSRHGRILNSRIVVVGSGFAGLKVAKALGRRRSGVTIIDRHNHHLFQPLLYHVATAALSAPDIAEPIRKILGRCPSVQFLFGDVAGIGTEGGMLVLADGTRFPIHTGPGNRFAAVLCRPGQLGSGCPGLKTIEDARTIGSRLLLSFELAERITYPVEQSRLMTIAIIGGGPTGVELAGSIAELSRHTLARDFRNIRPEKTSIILAEAGDRLQLADSAPGKARRRGRPRQSRRGGRSTEDHGRRQGHPGGLDALGRGVAASPLAARLGVGLDRGGRVKVASDLQVIGRSDVFALGDVALFLDENGQPLPDLSQGAKQEGEHLGRALARRVDTGEALRRQADRRGTG